MSETIIIHAVPSPKLKYSALYALIAQIPAGKVITKKVFFSYLSKAYQVPNLTEEFGLVYPKPRNRFDFPLWRLLTDTGMITAYKYEIWSYKAHLEEEGHSMTLKTRKKGDTYIVADYKQTMFDPALFVLPPKEEALTPPYTL